MAKRAAEVGLRRRVIHLFDTFEGMSPPTARDSDEHGDPAAVLAGTRRQDKSSNVWAYASRTRPCSATSLPMASSIRAGSGPWSPGRGHPARGGTPRHGHLPPRHRLVQIGRPRADPSVSAAHWGGVLLIDELRLLAGLPPGGGQSISPTVRRGHTSHSWPVGTWRPSSLKRQQVAAPHQATGRPDCIPGPLSTVDPNRPDHGACPARQAGRFLRFQQIALAGSSRYADALILAMQTFLLWDIVVVGGSVLPTLLPRYVERQARASQAEALALYTARGADLVGLRAVGIVLALGAAALIAHAHPRPVRPLRLVPGRAVPRHGGAGRRLHAQPSAW